MASASSSNTSVVEDEVAENEAEQLESQIQAVQDESLFAPIDEIPG